MLTSLGQQISLDGLLQCGNHTPLNWCGTSQSWKLKCCLWLTDSNRNRISFRRLPVESLFSVLLCIILNNHGTSSKTLWVTARTNSLLISLFGPSCIQCKTCGHWVSPCQINVSHVVVLAVRGTSSSLKLQCWFRANTEKESPEERKMD